jgi:hypothetical protein
VIANVNNPYLVVTTDTAGNINLDLSDDPTITVGDENYNEGIDIGGSIINGSVNISYKLTPLTSDCESGDDNCGVGAAYDPNTTYTLASLSDFNKLQSSQMYKELIKSLESVALP